MNIKKLICSLGLMVGLFVIPVEAGIWDWLPGRPLIPSEESEESREMREYKQELKKHEQELKKYKEGTPGYQREMERHEQALKKYELEPTEERDEDWELLNPSKTPTQKERQALEEIAKTQGQKTLTQELGEELKGGAREVTKDVLSQLKQEARENAPKIIIGTAVALIGSLGTLAGLGYDKFKKWLAERSENETNEQKQEVNKPTDGVATLIHDARIEINAVLAQLQANSIEDIRLKSGGAVSSFNAALKARDWNKTQSAITTLEKNITFMQKLATTLIDLNGSIKAVKKIEPNNVEFNTLVAELNDTIAELYNPQQAKELLSKTENVVADFKNKLEQAKQQPAKPTTINAKQTEGAGGEMVPELS